MTRWLVAVSAALAACLWGILSGGLVLFVATLAAIALVAVLVCWHGRRKR